MDNLSHTLFGTVLGAAVAPRLARTHRLSTMLASTALVNLPDIDVALLVAGRETYAFHHRGFTHSLLGLTIMVPVGVALLRLILGRAMATDPGRYGLAFQVGFVLVQFAIGHFLLDYLTTYGTLFLYPFDWTRFAYPLMFIVDPLFWLMSGLAFALVWRKDGTSDTIVRRRALLGLAACCLLWSIELAFKRTAELRAEKALKHPHDRQDPVTMRSDRLLSYPAPLAPGMWLALKASRDHSNGVRFQQASVSFFTKSNHTLVHPIPPHLRHQGMCTDQSYEESAHQAFESFKRWGEHIVCGPAVYEELSGCRCLSLKYSLVGSGVVTFGSFFIPPSGPGFFLPSDDYRKLHDFYRRLTLGSD